MRWFSSRDGLWYRVGFVADCKWKINVMNTWGIKSGGDCVYLQYKSCKISIDLDWRLQSPSRVCDHQWTRETGSYVLKSSVIFCTHSFACPGCLWRHLTCFFVVHFFFWLLCLPLLFQSFFDVRAVSRSGQFQVPVSVVLSGVFFCVLSPILHILLI